VSDATARLLPDECLGESKKPGRLLRSLPTGFAGKTPLVRRPRVPLETLAHCLAPTVRAHVAEGRVASEHRPVTVAFLRFEATDALFGERDGSVAAEVLHRLVEIVEAATERRDLALLASDIDADGGKLILTAGAPRITGDDEERMLLALREIVAAELPIPIRIGVHRGAVFAGDIGPVYRRTYTVMGDAVNVAARLMAKAEPGHIYATADVLDHSDTLFATTELKPLVVKGKAEPLRAWSVGPAVGSRARNVSLERLPLIGRNAELGVLRKALSSARSGKGRLVEVIGDPGVGKSRLLEAMRDAAMGFKKMHAVCEAYTASTPYVDWRELLRELLEIGRDESDAILIDGVRERVSSSVPELLPWLPLLAAAFGVEAESTPEVDMLAEKNRRPKLHETVARFLEVLVPGPAVIEIENAHHMNEASAELLHYLVGRLDGRKWMFGIARRRNAGGFSAPESSDVVRVDLKALAPQDALRMAQLASEKTPLPPHLLEVVAERSAGNPQFLRDLLHAAVESGGVGRLPDSAEAAAMARIDALAPDDRATIRRASVFGLTFHPRMLSWFSEEDDSAPPAGSTWERLREFFDDDGEGYLRFRHSLMRDAAYEGLPFKQRRTLHAAVAVHLEEEADDPDDHAGVLSLHYLAAGEQKPAFRYGNTAAKRAEAVYAYVEAAALYSRALEAANALPDLPKKEVGAVHEALADSWYRVGEYKKAGDAFSSAQKLVEGDPLAESGLLLKRSRLEEKLGQYGQALQLAERAREVVKDIGRIEATRHAALCSAWQATILQAQGHTGEAVERAERTVIEAEEADDPEALGGAYMVLGWASGVLGRKGGEELLKKSLEAYQRSGNRLRQASILTNLGVICQWEGRWDDAMAYYERGRDASLKLGNTVPAAVARINVSEILIDRGELTEAERLLQETLATLKASGYRYLLAACHWLLGRASVRAGRIEEALGRLKEARTNFEHVGAEQELMDVDARIAECRAHQDDADATLACADELLARAESENGEAKLIPLLQRVRGFAVLKQGDPFLAREAFDAGLEIARSREDRYETLLTLLALIEL
ncbi:MAG TPA: tetratricopeptide repeat protein, partial [Casimicrobiaceae bacterium]|nr:tetratricopeptide repeat protein [Casimicrobiaceae bacterium]